MKAWLTFFLLLSFSHITLAAVNSWGVKVIDKEKKLRIGGRVQGILENNNEHQTQNLYLRRLRVNVEFTPWENHLIYYDIRNDMVDYLDQEENSFVVGDAFWEIKLNNKYSLKNIRFFRAKVDVSYSQTSSSRHLFTPQRDQVSDYASSFIVHNRRASNIQLNGHYGQLAYHIALSDGVNSESLIDLSKKQVDSVERQKFTYGGKLRYFFIGDALKNQTQDTFYGKRQSFSIGLGYFLNDKIMIDNTSNNGQTFSLRRKLFNIELSFAYENFRLLGEYFKFDGDLIDLTQSTKNEILGSSRGEYLQTEYLFGKWAPFIRYEAFNRNEARNGFTVINTSLGLNYYERMDQVRYGVVWTKKDAEKNLSMKDEEQALAYIMLNF